MLYHYESPVAMDQGVVAKYPNASFNVVFEADWPEGILKKLFLWNPIC